MVIVDVIDGALPQVDVPYGLRQYTHNPILSEILHSIPSYGTRPIPDGTCYVPIRLQPFVFRVWKRLANVLKRFETVYTR
jgi:hypothetical protein